MKRRNNPEETSRILKQALIESIVEKGYAKTSINPILERTGLSKGAIFHHFKTREHLVAAAFSDLLDETASDFNALGIQLRTQKITIQEFLDELCWLITTDQFAVFMELGVVLRVTPKLLEMVSDDIEHFRTAIDEFWLQTFTIEGRNRDAQKSHWLVVMNVLRGLAFQRSFVEEPGTTERIRQELEHVLFRNVRVNHIK